MKKKNHISVLRGLISYHERMTTVCESTYKIYHGQIGLMQPVNVECSLRNHCEMYIDAIRTAAKVLEEDPDIMAEDLEESTVIIRCLIGYHKAVNIKSPKAEGDIYLEALEESLKVMKKVRKEREDI